MATDLGSEADRLASLQMGLIARFQLIGDPGGAALIDSRLRTGRWRPVAPGVYTFPGRAETWTRSLWISYLHAGPTAVVSHQSAANLRSIAAVPTSITLTVRRNRRHVRRAPAGAKWHRLDDLAERHVVIERGLRVTTPARTLIDIAVVVSRPRLLHATEDTIVRRLATIAEIGAALDSVRRRGKPGISKMGSVLDELGDRTQTSPSELDVALSKVIEISGLPTPIAEHPLPGSCGLRGSVDRYFPEALLIVEADGRKWHERRRNMAKDRERDVAAARAGHQTLRFMWEHLVADPHGSAQALVDVYMTRLGQLGRTCR